MKNKSVVVYSRTFAFYSRVWEDRSDRKGNKRR